MIDVEDFKVILFDDMIVKVLKLDGVDIVRRIVVKYWEVMKIGLLV